MGNEDSKKSIKTTYKTTDELHRDMLKIWSETKKTITIASHLIEESVALADRAPLMKDQTINYEFKITLPHPRHEQSTDFLNKTD